MPTTCPGCACQAPSAQHAIVAALMVDDVDRAMDLGLLDRAPCPACASECSGALLAVRDDRLRALAARDRFRSRAARLQRLAQERLARQAPPPAASPAQPAPALPTAAAEALARAKARAAQRRR